MGCTRRRRLIFFRLDLLIFLRFLISLPFNSSHSQRSLSDFSFSVLCSSELYFHLFQNHHPLYVLHVVHEYQLSWKCQRLTVHLPSISSTAAFKIQMSRCGKMNYFGWEVTILKGTTSKELILVLTETSRN